MGRNNSPKPSIILPAPASILKPQIAHRVENGHVFLRIRSATGQEAVLEMLPKACRALGEELIDCANRAEDFEQPPNQRT